MKITEMTVDDLDQFVNLADQLGYPEKLADLKKRFAFLAKDPNLTAFVAKDKGGMLIGWIQVNREPSTLLADDRAEISGLVVDENVRSQGVGEALLARAEKWAKDQGLNSMRVRTNVKREGAHKFYSREGYKLKKSWHLFVKELK